MNKLIQKIASLSILTLALTLLLSIGMGHWMSEEPMHHEDHECCDFIQMQASSPASTLLVIFLVLAAATIVVSSYKLTLIVKQLRFTPFYIQAHNRRLLKGVVQRE